MVYITSYLEDFIRHGIKKWHLYRQKGCFVIFITVIFGNGGGSVAGGVVLGWWISVFS